jgi:hypothetical protein
VKKKLLDYLGKLKENAVYVGKLKENAVYVGLFITSIIVVIVLYYLNFIDTEKITWTSISSGLIDVFDGFNHVVFYLDCS